ncbi:MAG: hypothetical protein ACQESB_04255 [Elusimicrobiota bacterium]
MAVFKSDNNNEKKEIDFELDFLMSLTVQQRFEMMFEKSQFIRSLLKKDENRKTTEIIKRK